MRIQLLFFLVFGCISGGYAQKDTLYSLPVEDVLQATPPKVQELISIASFQETVIRNSPSVITLITQEEIQKTGAREIIDVLRLVAGLDFAQNFDMVVGLGVRGNWAEEGKFLFMLDGQTINEAAFGTLMFYMRIPVGEIERVEIMRGAGSALYGGLASLCVINVISKHKTSGNSVAIHTQTGISTGGFARANLQASITQQIKPDMSIGLSVHVGQGNMSNKLVNSPVGTPINFKDSSQVNVENVRMSLRNKNMQATFLWNRYAFTAIPEVVTANPKELIGTMHDILFGVANVWKISKKWSLQPRLQWKTQRPWWYEGYQNLAGRATYDRYRTLNHRFTTGLILQFTPKDWYSLAVGSEFFWDYAKYTLNRYTFYNQRNHISFTNTAFFIENVFSPKIANLTVGMRADKNSAYQWAFAPRVALTKIWKNIHGKALLNYAFKAPTIQNIQYGYQKDMRPERVRTVEFEVGYHWKEKITVVLNLFDIQIKDPIIYVFDPNTLEEFYENKTQTGTRGAEIETTWKIEKLSLKANYAYYVNHNTQVSDYLVGERKDLLAGFPAHKTTFQMNYDIAKNWNIATTCLFFSEKFTYVYFGQGFTDFRLRRFEPTYSLNLHLHWKMPLKGWQTSLSLFNLTNQTLWFVSPVSSGVTPFPEQGREIVLKFRYKI